MACGEFVYHEYRRRENIKLELQTDTEKFDRDAHAEHRFVST